MNLTYKFSLLCALSSLYLGNSVYDAKAQPYVEISQINAPSGVAGLDSNTNVTAAIKNKQILTMDTYTKTDRSVVERPFFKMTPDSDSMFTLGDETIQMGGLYDSLGLTNPRSLTLIGRPYSNYNAGCTLCIFSTSSGSREGGAQAAISGIDYHSGANAVSNGDMAAVGFYQFSENYPARFVAAAKTFDANGVTLATPLTDAQQAQLHQGMYIATNVIDPNLPTTNSQGLFVSNAYWGFVKTWDATHITVYGWAVPSGGNSSNGQIPNPTYLDKTLSTYTTPMVFLGVPKKLFAENTYMVANGSHVLGNNASSLSNSYEREEFDFRANNWSKPNSLSFHGWTTSFDCSQCDAAAVNKDSYAYLVNGPNGLPRAYVAQMEGDALEFSGYSTMIGGAGAPEYVDAKGKTSSARVGSNHIMASFASNLPSNNTIHMNTIVRRESTITNDWRDYAVYLTMDVDSQRDSKAGLTGGSQMGVLAYNYNAIHYGGLCMLSYGSRQGLCQEGDGSVDLAKPFTSNDTALFKKPVRFDDVVNVGPSLTLSSAEYIPADKTVQAQGTVFTWNTVVNGGARTELINVDPTGGAGGVDFFNINTAQTIEGATPMLRLSPGRESFFNVSPVMKAGTSIAAGQNLSFPTNSADGNNQMVQFFYNPPNSARTNEVTNQPLDKDTFYFTNNRYGNHYQFNGDVTASKFIRSLSTPSSSSAPCTAGEFSDDSNYHYVCVATNKWKRVALADF